MIIRFNLHILHINTPTEKCPQYSQKKWCPPFMQMIHHTLHQLIHTKEGKLLYQHISKKNPDWSGIFLLQMANQTAYFCINTSPKKSWLIWNLSAPNGESNCILGRRVFSIYKYMTHKYGERYLKYWIIINTFIPELATCIWLINTPCPGILKYCIIINTCIPELGTCFWLINTWRPNMAIGILKYCITKIGDKVF